MLRILARNIVSNWLGLMVQVAVVFFLTPFVISSVGESRYGIWTLVSGITGYYGLLDLGFRAGITQYLTRHLASRDFDQLNRTASTACVSLAGCGAAVAVISLGLVWLAPMIFRLPADAVVEAQWCIGIVGVSTAIQFGFFPFSAVFAATQRYDVANVIGITIRLTTAAGIYLVLRNGYGLVGLCIVHASGELLGSLARWYTSLWILPELSISFARASWESLRSIASFGMWSFVTQNVATLRDYSSIVIAGVFMPVAALAYWNLAIALINYYNQFFGSISIVFFPAATQLDSTGDVQRLRTLYLSGSKMLLMLAIPISLIGGMWAGDFYTLWVGAQFVTGTEYPSVALLFRIQLVAAVFVTVQRIGIQILLGTRQLQALARLTTYDAISFLALLILLVRPMGLIGIAVAKLFPTVAVFGIIYPTIICRQLAIPMVDFLRRAIFRPLLALFVLMWPLWLIRHFGPPADSWRTLILVGALAGFISLPVVIFIGLDNTERRRFIVEPLKRLSGRSWCLITQR